MLGGGYYFLMSAYVSVARAVQEGNHILRVVYVVSRPTATSTALALFTFLRVRSNNTIMFMLQSLSQAMRLH